VLNEAKQITIEEAPLSHRLDFVCSYGIVTGAFISEHTLRRDKAQRATNACGGLNGEVLSMADGEAYCSGS